MYYNCYYVAGHKTHLFPQLSYKNCSFVLDLEPHKSELIED